MKKTNGRSRTDPHNRNVTETKKQHRKEANNIVNNHHITWHDAQSSMIHVRFNEAWHGKVHKQHYKLSGAQYATPLHIDETPRELFSSILFMYPTILNVIKHDKRVKHDETI